MKVALYRRNAEERARQELQVKLDQVNLFLQVGKRDEKICLCCLFLRWFKTK